MRTTHVALIVLSLALLGVPAGPLLSQETKPDKAAELTVDQIINKANYVSYYQAADGRAKVGMTKIGRAHV